MSLCGCYPACSCQLNVEPPDLLTLTGNGDVATGGWLLTASETAFGAVNNDGGVSITPGGPYGHNPSIDLVIEDSDTVNLSVGPSGLRADVIAVPGDAGGVPPGVSLSYHGATAPAGYLLEYGQLVDIADYPDLFAAIGHVGNGGVDPGGGQFRIPEGRGLFDLGRDDMGGVAAGNVTGATTLGATGGNEDAQLGVSNLPAHTHTETGSHSHPVTDLGHSHTASADTHAGHQHAPNASGTTQLFVTVDAATTDTVSFTNNAPDDITIPVNDNPTDLTQNTRGQTATAGAHSHLITVDSNGVNGSNISVGQNTDLVTVGGGGNGAALGNSFLILPPYRVVNKIIKT